MVCNEVAKGVGQINLTSDIPVMFGVITTEDIEQAIERSGSKAGNKGSECAQGVLEMINLVETNIIEKKLKTFLVLAFIGV